MYIPVYNVDGALSRQDTSRVNQNGPEAFGFRGNARHLDLNRDFIKADSLNARTFAQVFTRWDPDVMVDTHTSNGADYQHVVTLIATQQPMARDLRLIAAIMEIVGELERIHDYVKGIGKISLNLGPKPVLPTIAAHMPEMAETAREMLHLSPKAFAERDKELPLRVPARTRSN